MFGRFLSQPCCTHMQNNPTLISEQGYRATEETRDNSRNREGNQLMTATGPVPARYHRLKRGREASKFVGTQASTHAELHPDNSRDQIHVQTPGQNCVLGLQSSPSSSAVYSLPFSSRKHYPKSFFFLLFFFGSPLVI